MSKGKFKMTPQAASRIQSAAAKNPDRKTSTTNFASRAQSSEAKNTAGGNR
jgi:hypothetical protein